MKRLDSEDKAGLYITVIFHLVVLIILLASQIGAALRSENTFVIDFSKQEAVQKEKEEIRIEPGSQCTEPYECWYYEYCHGVRKDNEQLEIPYIRIPDKDQDERGVPE